MVFVVANDTVLDGTVDDDEFDDVLYVVVVVL